MTDVYSREPSHDAFTRSHQRLQAEMTALEQKERERSERTSPWTNWFKSSVRRWVTVAATIVLIFIIASAGTIAASANSLPGELLYSVKHATEQARLALAFSDLSKADLHLNYAERRAVEMSTLIEYGNITSVEETAAKMEEHLVASGQFAAKAGQPEAVLFKTKLETSATLTLGQLEAAINQAPEEIRGQLFQSLVIVKEGYDLATEALPLPVEPTPESPISTEPEVTPSTTPTPSPQLITPEPTSGTETTPEAPLPQVVEIIGTVQSLSTEQLMVDGQIVVITASTNISGVIASGAMVSVTGTRNADGAIIASCIDVIVQIPLPTVPTPLITTPTPDPHLFVIVGELTSILPTLWVVDGSQVVITSQTTIQGLPLIGLSVQVEGFIQADGKTVATTITVLSSVPTPTPSTTPTPPPTPTTSTTPTPTPTPTAEPQPFVIVGNLTSILSTLWIIDGLQIVITPQTTIQGLPLIGLSVRVEGFIQTDGKAVATLITVLP